MASITRRSRGRHMVIIAVLGGLIVGGAVFAAIKNNGKASDEKYTRLKIG